MPDFDTEPIPDRCTELLRVKLVTGALNVDGGDVSGTNQLPVSVSGTPPTTGKVIRPTITTSASPDYAANDVVSGIVTLTGVMAADARTALLRSIALKDGSGQAPALSLLFFRATPSGGTYTDNTALVWGSGDLANLVGVVRVLTTDWVTIVSESLVSFGGVDIIVGSADDDLYLLIIADAAWNAGSTSDLTAEFGFEQR